MLLGTVLVFLSDSISLKPVIIISYIGFYVKKPIFYFFYFKYNFIFIFYFIVVLLKLESAKINI